MIRIFLIAGLIAFVACAGTTTNFSVADLHANGRTEFSNSRLELIGTAASFGFTFDGTDCKIFAGLSDWQDHNYLQYELDGVYQGRIRVDKSGEALLIQAPEKGMHSVWIYKATEAHTGPIFIEKIEGSNLEPLEWKKAPVIEFIGNSITCGAAADASEVPCGEGEYHDQHNAYYAYGPRVARALDINYVMSSVSGIGIYRNWNSDGPTMPQVYEKSDFREDSDRMWDFARYTPDIVSIALGTNDFSLGDGKHERLPFDSGTYVATYISFVKLVKSKYPHAQIALLSSAMVGGDTGQLFQRCLTAVKENIDAAYPSDKPVALHFFAPMRTRGCTGHPSVEDHEILADELIPFFKGLL